MNARRGALTLRMVKCNENEQFWWAVSETLRANGPPPGDVEDPKVGDIRQHPTEGHQVWTGAYWYPRTSTRKEG